MDQTHILHMVGEHTRVEWKCPKVKNATRPKAYFIIWIMLYKRLTTVDRLEKWRLNVSSTYELCSRENETMEHLMTQ